MFNVGHNFYITVGALLSDWTTYFKLIRHCCIERLINSYLMSKISSLSVASSSFLLFLAI